MVGLGGLEPPTSPLSGARSSHLSYRPKSRNNFKILTGGQGRAQLQPRYRMLSAEKASRYWTKPTFGGGVLPSGDSLILPNCASYRARFSPMARQMRFACPGGESCAERSAIWQYQ